jgi:hypothetical protein
MTGARQIYSSSSSSNGSSNGMRLLKQGQKGTGKGHVSAQICTFGLWQLLTELAAKSNSGDWQHQPSSHLTGISMRRSTGYGDVRAPASNTL